MTRKHLSTIALLCVLGSGAAQVAANPPPVQDPRQPMQSVPPAAPVDRANVTITDSPGNSISPNYRVDFAAMDANGDGAITRAEARGNPDLTREFHVVDGNHDGRLSREEMKGWID